MGVSMLATLEDSNGNYVGGFLLNYNSQQSVRMLQRRGREVSVN